MSEIYSLYRRAMESVSIAVNSRAIKFSAVNVISADKSYMRLVNVTFNLA